MPETNIQPEGTSEETPEQPQPITQPVEQPQPAVETPQPAETTPADTPQESQPETPQASQPEMAQAPEIPETPQKPKKSKKLGLMVGVAVLLLVVVGGAYYYFTSNDTFDTPPTLGATESNLQGFLQKDVDFGEKVGSYKFLGFEEADKTAFATNKAAFEAAGELPIKLETNNENKGLHYVYATEDKTFEEIAQSIDPVANAIAIAYFSAEDNKWLITENNYYKAEAVDPATTTIPAGHTFAVFSTRDTEIFGVSDGTIKPTENFPICEQAGPGWYNFAVKDFQSISQCLDSFSSIWIQNQSDPTSFEKITTAEIKLRNRADDLTHYIMWAKLKETPVIQQPDKTTQPTNQRVGTGTESAADDTTATIPKADGQKILLNNFAVEPSSIEGVAIIEWSESDTSIIGIKYQAIVTDSLGEIVTQVSVDPLIDNIGDEKTEILVKDKTKVIVTFHELPTDEDLTFTVTATGEENSIIGIKNEPLVIKLAATHASKEPVQEIVKPVQEIKPVQEPVQERVLEPVFEPVQDPDSTTNPNIPLVDDFNNTTTDPGATPISTSNPLGNTPLSP